MKRTGCRLIPEKRPETGPRYVEVRSRKVSSAPTGESDRRGGNTPNAPFTPSLSPAPCVLAKPSAKFAARPCACSQDLPWRLDYNERVSCAFRQPLSTARENPSGKCTWAAASRMLEKERGRDQSSPDGDHHSEASALVFLRTDSSWEHTRRGDRLPSLPQGCDPCSQAAPDRRTAGEMPPRIQEELKDPAGPKHGAGRRRQRRENSAHLARSTHLLVILAVNEGLEERPIDAVSSPVVVHQRQPLEPNSQLFRELAACGVRSTEGGARGTTRSNKEED